MQYNDKTKSVMFREITPEEKARNAELVARGVMISTAHPSDEEIENSAEYRRTHKFNENVREILKARGFRV